VLLSQVIDRFLEEGVNWKAGQLKTEENNRKKIVFLAPSGMV
jgi:hypothetical protein